MSFPLWGFDGHKFLQLDSFGSKLKLLFSLSLASLPLLLTLLLTL
uniref:Uncharacterized protein n=1 Tax=Rhizophora mucronata TaxID=61149 RepID=A0A2P2J065_RHIMU